MSNKELNEQMKRTLRNIILLNLKLLKLHDKGEKRARFKLNEVTEDLMREMNLIT